MFPNKQTALIVKALVKTFLSIVLTHSSVAFINGKSITVSFNVVVVVLMLDRFNISVSLINSHTVIVALGFNF